MVDETNPLESLERLMGGDWHYLGGNVEDNPLAYHRFEWGPGQNSILSRSYDTDGEIVSQGFWYYHPGDDAVKGVGASAGHEGVKLFEYTQVTVEDDVMHCDLTAHGDRGATLFAEEWTFIDDDHYDWRLLLKAQEEDQEVMTARFERRNG